jgi:hypothetical protein
MLAGVRTSCGVLIRYRPNAHDVLGRAGSTFIGHALFPRPSYRLRWPTRLRGGRLLLCIAWNTAVAVWLREWLTPMLRDAAEKHEGIKRQLRWELGREPNEREVHDRVAENIGGDMTPPPPEASESR